MSATNPIAAGLTINRAASTGGPPGPPAGVAVPQYIWRPGGIFGGNVLVTWGDCEAVIAANFGRVVLLVDPSLAPAVIPGTADTECFGRVEFAAYSYNIASYPVITVQDGGRLRNPWIFTSVQIQGAPTIRPFILREILGSGLIFQRGPGLRLQAGANKSAINVNNDAMITSLFEGGSVDNQAPGIALIRVDPGLLHLFSVVAEAGAGTTPGYPSDLFGGGAGGNLIRIMDASATPIAQPLWLGAITDQPYDKARGVTYDDALVLPPLGVDNVQAAIDALKSAPAPVTPLPPEYIAGLEVLYSAFLSGVVLRGRCIDSTNTQTIALAFDTVFDFTIVGANGRDQVAAFGVQAWIALYAIWGAGPGSALLGSLNFAAPALPAGYTHFRRIGTMHTDLMPQLEPWGYFGRNQDREYRAKNTLSGYAITIGGPFVGPFAFPVAPYANFGTSPFVARWTYRLITTGILAPPGVAYVSAPTPGGTAIQLFAGKVVGDVVSGTFELPLYVGLAGATNIGLDVPAGASLDLGFYGWNETV